MRPQRMCEQHRNRGYKAKSSADDGVLLRKLSLLQQAKQAIRENRRHSTNGYSGLTGAALTSTMQCP